MTFNLNDFSQTVRERLLYNAVALGELKQVLDRDEDPDKIADNAKLLPTACVIPVGAGKLTMKLGMGSSDMLEDFQQNIVIYYQQSKDNKVPYSDIDIIREYILQCVEGGIRKTLSEMDDEGILPKSVTDISARYIK